MAAQRRRAVEPMTDWVNDGTRLPAFVHDAIGQQAVMMGVSQQEMKRDVLLGATRLEPMILESCFQARYGRPRTAQEGAGL